MRFRFKKILIVFSVAAIFVMSMFAFSGCGAGAPDDTNLIVNGRFNRYTDGALDKGDFNADKWEKDAKGTSYVKKTYDFYNKCIAPGYENTKYKSYQKWAQELPEGWKVATSDPLIASVAGYEYGDNENALTLLVDATSKPAASGWIKIYQKVKVNRKTNYKLSFKYNGTLRKPADNAGKAAGLTIGFFEDPSYVDPAAFQSASFIVNLGAFSGSYTSPVFNSGNMGSLTVSIGLGAEGHAAGDARVNITEISLMEEVASAAAPAHTVYKNGGYRDSNALPVIFTCAAFLALILICIFVTHSINKNYVYAKPDAGKGGKTDAKNAKGKPKKRADLLADDTDSAEIPVDGGGAAEDESSGAPAEENVNMEEGINAGGVSDGGGDDGFDDGSDASAASAAPVTQSRAGAAVRNLCGRAWGAFKMAASKAPFLFILLAAFLIRIIFVFVIKGYRPDITAALSAASKLMESGTGYYASNEINYAPGQLYLYYYIGLFRNWFNILDGSRGMVFVLKLPGLIADLSIGYLIYSFTKRFVNKKAALGISALYLLNPAVIFAFTVYGGMDAVYIFFLVLTLRFLLDKKYLKMCFAYAAAVFFSENALMIAPLLLVYLCAAVVKAIRGKMHADDPNFKKKISDADDENRALWQTPVGIAAFFLTLIIASLPFTVKGLESGGKFAFFSVFPVYSKLSIHFSIFTNNGFNISAIFGKNGMAYDGANAYIIVLYFVMAAILGIIYVMKRNRANLLLLSSVFFFIAAYFMPEATPVTVVPGIVLLIFACAAIGDRRLYGSLFIFSALSLINVSSVMISNQYMNSLPDYIFDPNANPLYGGAAQLPKVFMIVFSAVSVLAFLYFMYTVLDITVSNRRKIFMPFDKEAPHYAPDTFKSLFR